MEQLHVVGAVNSMLCRVQNKLQLHNDWCCVQIHAIYALFLGNVYRRVVITSSQSIKISANPFDS